MKTEVSAGGIVVRKRDKDWMVLLVRDIHEEWTFPKGKVQAKEDLEHAAMREVGEEVGVTHVTKLKKLPVIRYFYTRNNLINKSVHYFIFLSDGRDKLINQIQEGIHDATWMPLSTAISVIGYKKTNTPILVQTQKFLTTYGH